MFDYTGFKLLYQKNKTLKLEIIKNQELSNVFEKEKYHKSSSQLFSAGDRVLMLTQEKVGGISVKKDQYSLHNSIDHLYKNPLFFVRIQEPTKT